MTYPDWRTMVGKDPAFDPRIWSIQNSTHSPVNIMHEVEIHFSVFLVHFNLLDLCFFRLEVALSWTSGWLRFLSTFCYKLPEIILAYYKFQRSISLTLVGYTQLVDEFTSTDDPLLPKSEPFLRDWLERHQPFC